MKSVTRKSATYALVWGVPAALSMLATSLLSRIVGADAFGVYALTTSSALLVSAGAFQWLRFSALRFVSERPEQASEDISTARRATVAVAGLLLLAGAILGITLKSPIIFLGTILAALQGSFEIGLAIARSRDKTFSFGIASLTRTLGLLVLGLLAGHYIGGGLSLLTALACALGLANLTLLAQWRSKAKSSSQVLSKYWTFGWPASLAAGLLASLPAVERFMLNALINTSAVGVYSTITDLVSQLMLAGFVAIGLASFPTLVFLHSNKTRHELHQQWRSLSTLLTFLSTFLAAIMLMYSREIASILVGREFRASFVQLLPYVVASAALNGFRAYAIDPAFHIANRTRALLYISAAMLAIHVMGMALLVPMSGIVGAAQASTATFALGLAISWNTARRTGLVSIATLETLILLICGASAIAAAIYLPNDWSSNRIVIKASILLGIYGIGFGLVLQVKKYSASRS